MHEAAHRFLDRDALGADFLVCSPHKFFGPHLGVLVADPDRLATLRPEKLLASSDAVPERFELGTLPYELLAGTTAAVDYLAAHGVNAPAGSFYAVEASRRLDLGDGGAVRAGVAPYTDADDVERLLAAVDTLVR